MQAQSEFFDKPKRKPPRVLMHVIDAGEGVRFQCQKCGHKTGWLKARTLSEDKRGRPCPRCNA